MSNEEILKDLERMSREVVDDMNKLLSIIIKINKGESK